MHEKNPLKTQTICGLKSSSNDGGIIREMRGLVYQLSLSCPIDGGPKRVERRRSTFQPDSSGKKSLFGPHGKENEDE